MRKLAVLGIALATATVTYAGTKGLSEEERQTLVGIIMNVVSFVVGLIINPKKKAKDVDN